MCQKLSAPLKESKYMCYYHADTFRIQIYLNSIELNGSNKYHNDFAWSSKLQNMQELKIMLVVLL